MVVRKLVENFPGVPDEKKFYFYQKLRIQNNFHSTSLPLYYNLRIYAHAYTNYDFFDFVGCHIIFLF